MKKTIPTRQRFLEREIFFLRVRFHSRYSADSENCLPQYFFRIKRILIGKWKHKETRVSNMFQFFQLSDNERYQQCPLLLATAWIRAQLYNCSSRQNDELKRDIKANPLQPNVWINFTLHAQQRLWNNGTDIQFRWENLCVEQEKKTIHLTMH